MAALSDDVAASLDAGDVCSAAVRADELLAETRRAINAGEIPAEFQEPLTARANELVNEVNCERAETTTADEPADADGAKKPGKQKEKKKDKPADDEDSDEPAPTEVVPTEPVPTETGD